MTKKPRTPEIHFYEFNIDLWFMSETRLRCSLAAKGAYLELLHYCYKHGSIPADTAGMAAICGCTQTEMEEVFPAFQNKFTISKSDASRKVNSVAEIFRKNYFLYLKKQSQNRRGKRTEKPTPKPSESNDLDNGGQSTDQPPSIQVIRNETKRNETIQDETNEDETIPPITNPSAAVLQFKTKTPGEFSSDDWPQTSEAIRSFFPVADDGIIVRIALAAIKENPKVTDKETGEAVYAVYTSAQQSPALFLTTVPKFIAAKLKGASARGHPPASTEIPKIDFTIPKLASHVWLKFNVRQRRKSTHDQAHRKRWLAIRRTGRTGSTRVLRVERKRLHGVTRNALCTGS